MTCSGICSASAFKAISGGRRLVLPPRRRVRWVVGCRLERSRRCLRWSGGEEVVDRHSLPMDLLEGVPEVSMPTLGQTGLRQCLVQRQCVVYPFQCPRSGRRACDVPSDGRIHGRRVVSMPTLGQTGLRRGQGSRVGWPHQVSMPTLGQTGLRLRQVHGEGRPNPRVSMPTRGQAGLRLTSSWKRCSTWCRFNAHSRADGPATRRRRPSRW